MDEAAARQVDRLRRLERALLGAWAFCAAAFLLENLVEAASGPENLGQVLRAWPTVLWAVLALGGIAGGVQFLKAIRSRAARVAAVVVLAGSTAWVGLAVGILVLYTLTMSGFD